MSYRTIRCLICDNCGKKLERVGETFWQMDLAALQIEWSKNHTYRGDVIHMCSECSCLETPDWWDAEVYGDKYRRTEDD